MPSTPGLTTEEQRTADSHGPDRHSIISRLPVELLSEIFRWYVASAIFWHPFGQDWPPLILTHVCSSWRNIVMSLPRLWTQVVIPSAHPCQTPHDDCLHQCNDWLQRSFPHPVAVDFPCYNMSCMGSRLAIDVLAKHASRITRLDLHLSEQGDHCKVSMITLFALPPGTFPVLTHLGLSVRFDIFRTGKVITAFDQSPLRTLHLDYEPLMAVDSIRLEEIFKITWEGLEELYMDPWPAYWPHGYTANASSFVIEHLRDIRVLGLTLPSTPSPHAVPPTVLPSRTAFPHMRTLRITLDNMLDLPVDDATTDHALFQVFDLPALEQITLLHTYQHRGREGMVSPTILSGLFEDADFIQTSLGRLRRLFVQDHGRIPDQKLLDVLEATPMLEELQLWESMELRIPFYGRMASSSDLVPRLQTLRIHYADDESEDVYEAMTRGVEVLLRGRWGEGKYGPDDEASVLKRMSATRGWPGSPGPRRKLEQAWVDAMEALRPTGAGLHLR
ncbi:uncharacterized protein SCHCODRAFT_02666514 [Schizophyllum commune H4-8]|nr:uncharacterized protein SCHCODRAFT_02666514 [Schizophyllum commune H4-8]KAI5893408.1 hypothetical protein SCHCODRAFT_02666514 [Schizophyllum commune H4-8]